MFLSLYASSLRSVPYLQMAEHHALHTEACKLVVVVLLFTGATYNNRVLSHYYSNTTSNVIYRSTHIYRMRLIKLKAIINDNSVRGLIMIILVPGGARLYENINIPNLRCCYLTMFACQQQALFERASSLHQVTVITVRQNPQAFLIGITDLVWE